MYPPYIQQQQYIKLREEIWYIKSLFCYLINVLADLNGAIAHGENAV